MAACCYQLLDIDEEKQNKNTTQYVSGTVYSSPLFLVGFVFIGLLVSVVLSVLLRFDYDGYSRNAVFTTK
jgi:hypothetical protein